MKISRGGVEWACLWYIPMFRFPGVKRGDGVFSSCFGTCCLYFERGVGGGRLVVRLCSECIIFVLTTPGVLLLEVVVVLAVELSLAMASSVWGFVRARFSRIK